MTEKSRFEIRHEAAIAAIRNGTAPKPPKPDRHGEAMQRWILRNAKFSERVFPGGPRIIRNDKPVPSKEK